MRSSLALASAIALALALALPALAATDKPVTAPADAARVTSGNYTVTFWVLPPTNLTAGGSGTVMLELAAANGTFVHQANATIMGTANATTGSDVALRFENATDSFTVPNGTNATAVGFSFPFTIDANTSGTASYAWTVGVDNATLHGTGSAEIQGANVPVPAPVGIPRWAYYAGGALLVLLVGAVLVSARQRNVRRRMRGETRSQALREAELERMAEKRPEQAQQIKQEIRQQEQVREKRRELQILEAKRADVVKNMDLLKKRHDMGALSKLQYDNMMSKRNAELAKLDAEIAQMEAEDAAGAASA